MNLTSALLQGAIPTTPLELIRESTATTRVVLGVLAVLSLISWAVILLTWVRLAMASGRAGKFADEFDKLKRLDEGVSLAVLRSTRSPDCCCGRRTLSWRRVARVSGSRKPSPRTRVHSPT
jgi:hypothetical protein